MLVRIYLLGLLVHTVIEYKEGRGTSYVGSGLRESVNAKTEGFG